MQMKRKAEVLDDCLPDEQKAKLLDDCLPDEQNAEVSTDDCLPKDPKAPQVLDDSSLSTRQKPKILVIAGPTGVGKTALALALATQLGGEIVSADSVQVYTGLDVGSAKTPVSERQGITHHLVDIVSPTDEFTAGCFHDKAREATSKVLEKGRVPIVVGGTGMYLKWYMQGKAAAPKSCPEAVAAVEQELADLQQGGGGWDEALKMLSDGGDTQTPRSLERNDWYRLRRALEILRSTGRPRTDFPLVATLTSQDGTRVPALEYDFRCYFLHKPRIELYRQIDLRCEEMVAAPKGLLHEASWLLDLGVSPNSSPASRAIGYRQAMEYLTSCRERAVMSSEQQFLSFLASFQKASRNFARRQHTWFRSEPLFQWVDASQGLETLVQAVADDFRGRCTLVKGQVMAASYEEGEELKRYQTQLRIFHDPTAVATVIDWIKSTQKAKASQTSVTTSESFVLS